jgi:hypothetical protein
MSFISARYVPTIRGMYVLMVYIHRQWSILLKPSNVLPASVACSDEVGNEAMEELATGGLSSILETMEAC